MRSGKAFGVPGVFLLPCLAWHHSPCISHASLSAAVPLQRVTHPACSWTAWCWISSSNTAKKQPLSAAFLGFLLPSNPVTKPGLLPCPCLKLHVGDSRVKAVGARVLFRAAGRASGRRKAELANLFLSAPVSHAKDCVNSANPRCLWSNLVYSASASNGCSDRNFTQAICLPKLSGSGRLVFRPQCPISLSQRFGDTLQRDWKLLGGHWDPFMSICFSMESAAEKLHVK